MKLKKLTDEQKAKMPEWRDKWIAIGLDTKRANRASAEEWCRKAYEVAGLKPPKLILWAESPIGLFLTAKLIKEIGKKGLKPYVGLAKPGVWDSVQASVEESVRGSGLRDEW